MNPSIASDIDSTVLECEPIKFDSPETIQTQSFWGNMDLFIYPNVFDSQIIDNTMSTSRNKYVLPDLLRNISITKSFSKLPVNWNDNGAVQFTKKLIDLTVEILRKLDYQPEVFPTARASILLEYGKPDGKFLGVEIFENRIESFVAPEGNTSSLQLCDVDELRKIVNDFND